MPNQLNLNMPHQCQTEWCWAAVAISVAEFLGNPGLWTQCSLASAQLGQPDDACFGSDGSDPDTCNKPANLEDSLSLVQHFSSRHPNPASGVPQPQVIKQEIDNGRPVGAKIEWPQSGKQGHFVLITGYDDSVADFSVFINDPEKPDGAPPNPYSLAGLKNSGYQSSGSWTYTYFTA